VFSARREKRCGEGFTQPVLFLLLCAACLAARRSGSSTLERTPNRLRYHSQVDMLGLLYRTNPSTLGRIRAQIDTVRVDFFEYEGGAAIWVKYAGEDTEQAEVLFSLFRD
jgi:hypothetical protein